MNGRTIVIIVAVLVVIFAGVFVYQRFAPSQIGNQTGSPLPTITNSAMLDTGSHVQIATESNVEYFPGAKGYFVRPEAQGTYPGVIMIHENRGLRPEIRDTADQLAKEGYIVLAVDLFNGQVVESQDQARNLTSSFDQKTGTANMQAAVNYLKSKGATKIASLGWCFGGRQSVELAISGEKLDATVVYYGGGMKTKTNELAPIKWPVLGIFGDKDQAIPVSMVREFESSLDTLGIENEIHIYPGVGHAFANPSGQNYAPTETKDAWDKTRDFLNEHLKS